MKIQEAVFTLSLVALGTLQMLGWFWLPKTKQGERKLGAVIAVMTMLIIISGIFSVISYAEDSKMTEILTYGFLIALPLWAASRVIAIIRNQS